jgi:hypothetical protein
MIFVTSLAQMIGNKIVCTGGQFETRGEPAGARGGRRSQRGASRGGARAATTATGRRAD